MCCVWLREERRFNVQIGKKQMKMSRTRPIKWVLALTQIADEGEFIQREKLGGRQLWGWSRQRLGEKNESKSVIQRAMGKGWGAAGRDKLRKGARLPLSCVSWPAVKSSSLPVSTGSPQGAIVPDSEGETGTERATDRGLNNLVELLMNLSFWRLSVSWYSSHAGLPYTTFLLILPLNICMANARQISSRLIRDGFMFAWLIHSPNRHKDRMRLPSGMTVAHSQGLKPTVPLPAPISMFTNKLDYGDILPLFHRQSIVLFLVTIGPNASQRLVAKRLQRWLVLLQGDGSFKLFQSFISFHLFF